MSKSLNDLLYADPCDAAIANRNETALQQNVTCIQETFLILKILSSQGMSEARTQSVPGFFAHGMGIGRRNLCCSPRDGRASASYAFLRAEIAVRRRGFGREISVIVCCRPVIVCYWPVVRPVIFPASFLKSFACQGLLRFELACLQAAA